MTRVVEIIGLMLALLLRDGRHGRRFVDTLRRLLILRSIHTRFRAEDISSRLSRFRGMARGDTGFGLVIIAKGYTTSGVLLLFLRGGLHLVVAVVLKKLPLAVILGRGCHVDILLSLVETGLGLIELVDHVVVELIRICILLEVFLVVIL